MIREQFRIMAVLKISLGVATVALSEPIEAIEMKLMADFVLIPMTINVSRSLSPIKSLANSATAVVEVNCTNKIVFIIFPPNINLSNKIPTSTFAEVGIYRSFLSIQ